MALIVWDKSLEVGINAIDTQHKKLVAMANELNDAMNSRKGNDVLGKLFTALIAYTVEHFAMEEQLMQKHDYPDKANHMKEHTDLKATVSKLQGEFASGKMMMSMSVLTFLREWLSKHIKGTDMAFGKFLASKNVR